MILAFAPDGSDAASGTGADHEAAWTNRVQTRSRLAALIAANPGPHEVISGPMVSRYSPGFSLTTGFLLSFSGANAEAIRLRSAGSVVSGAPMLTLCDWKVTTATGDWVDTGTLTTSGTKIWRYDNAVVAGGYQVRRMLKGNIITDPAFGLDGYVPSELWEGGCGKSTNRALTHGLLDRIPDEDVFGHCWTSRDLAGALSQSLYMACHVNPITFYGALSFLTDESSGVITFGGLSGFQCGRDVRLWGGGQLNSSLFRVGQLGLPVAKYSPKHEYVHQFAPPIVCDDTFRAIEITPWVDPRFGRKVPCYWGDTPGNGTGPSNGVLFKNTCETASATGWPENGGIPAALIKHKDDDGYRAVIRDMQHCSIGDYPPTGGRVHQFIRVEPGIEHDFKNVRYGRAIAFAATPATVHDIDVKGQRIHNQPTQSQLCGGNMEFSYSYVHSAPNVGVYTSPAGLEMDKTKTSCGVTNYASVITGLANVTIGWNFFDCEDGGWATDCYDGVGITGPVKYIGNVINRRAQPGFTNAVMGFAPMSTRYSTLDAASTAQLYYESNTEIGFSGTSVWGVQATPAINSPFTPENALPANQNAGWRRLADLEAYRQSTNALVVGMPPRRRP